MTRNPILTLRLVVLLVACALATGCGKKTPPEKVTVEGKVVRADGKPVTGMLVSFDPQEDVNKTDNPSDVLSKEGSFRFQCLPGRYKAAVAPIQGHGHATAGPGAAPGPVSAPPPGGILKVSPSEVDIPAGGTKTLVLTLKKQ